MYTTHVKILVVIDQALQISGGEGGGFWRLLHVKGDGNHIQGSYLFYWCTRKQDITGGYTWPSLIDK